MEDVPVKLPWPKDAAQVFRNISTYVAASKKLMKSLPEEQRTQLGQLLDQADAWVAQNRSKGMSQDDAQAYLDSFKKSCGELTGSVTQPLVAEICQKIVSSADAAAQALVSTRTNLSSTFATPRPHVRKSTSEPNSMSFENGSDYFRLHITTYNKLKYLFEKARGSPLTSADDDEFHSAAWSLHFRYRALLGGLRRFEGSGLQAAVPPHTFDALTKVFDVSMECFGSPFNCNFANFCSVFDDIDPLFSSYPTPDLTLCFFCRLSCFFDLRSV